ncbi:MAG TPA: hypothetical protein DHN33_00760 [Eubacteriaceae bacterium]|nr:hypothetical protein [Eubacteriaceae bacterium]
MVSSEMFINGTVPSDEDDYHVEIEMDVSTGKIATEFCPEEVVEKVVRIRKPDDRFPSGVRERRPDYVAGPEKGVLAPDEDDVCEVHSENSIVGIEIVNPDGQPVERLSLAHGETKPIAVRGITQSGERTNNVNNVTLAANNDKVEISGSAPSFNVKGVAPGNSEITATIKFSFEDSDGESSEYTYTDSIQATIAEKTEITLQYKGNTGSNLSAEIVQGDSFNEPKATVNTDVKINKSIRFNGNPVDAVDPSKAGTYEIIYRSSDETAQASFKLTVKKKPADNESNGDDDENNESDDG